MESSSIPFKHFYAFGDRDFNTVAFARDPSRARIVEWSFLRAFARALDADALATFRALVDDAHVNARDAFDRACNRSSSDDDDGSVDDARVVARRAEACAAACVAFGTWCARARASAVVLCEHLYESSHTTNGKAFMERFADVIGAQCVGGTPARLQATTSAWYGERANEFDARVRERWGNEFAHGVCDETHALHRQGSMARDIASAREVMGEEWTERCAAPHRALARCHESLGRVIEGAIARAMGERVRAHVVETCGGVFDSPRLRATLRWSRAVLLEFFTTATSRDGDKGAIESMRGRLEYAVHEHLGALRIHELFDIVVEYPDSLPAIADLRACLQNTTLHAELVDSFVAATRSRLLHAGASTVDIVQQYIGTIKTLLELDPSGVVLDLVSEPVKEYLRERKDTIRCVVTMLTDDGGGDHGDGEGALYAELGRLARGETVEVAESSVPAPNPNATIGATDNLDRLDSITAEMVAIAAELGEYDEFDVGAKQVMSGWDAWEPEPVETEAAASRGRRRKVGDIIGLLVGIYGSKELFINEYRTMLADKLLSKTNYDTERETHTLELLKLRFGETCLHNCEVMLKDFADSKRANVNIKTVPTTGTPSLKDRRASEILRHSPVEATIVSSIFWPAFSTEVADFKLPKEIQEHMDAYANRYHRLKAPRKMEWKPALGTVVMDVTHNDRTFEVSVNPVQASILHHFIHQSDWSANDLADVLDISIDALRKRIVLWINYGVLVERKDERGVVYALADPADDIDSMTGVHDDEHESAVASAEETAAAGMIVYEQYVMGMLTNFPSLPLERIHNMLKMFVVDPVYDKSSSDLERFLKDLVTREKLTMEGTSYAKKK